MVQTTGAKRLSPALLEAFRFARQLSSAGQRTLAEGLEERRYPAKALVLAEGDQCPSLLLIEQGHLRVFKTSESGREITLYRVRPGDSCVISMSSVLAGTPYPAHVEAPVASVATAIPGALFKRLFESEPAVQGLVIDQLSTLLTELMTLIAEVAFRRMDQRLAAFLLEETKLGLPLELSHEEIATHLGTARTVVSRLLENFKDDSLISIGRRQIQVVDRAGLHAIHDQ